MSLRASTSSFDLCLSSTDLLLPAATSNKSNTLRRSISSLNELLTFMPESVELSAEEMANQEELQAKINNDYPLYNFTAKLEDNNEEIIKLTKHFFPNEDLSNLTVC